MDKTITIITPVFNGEKYLEKTINSVINQTYKNVEYIIVDGGSTDNTKKIIEKYRDKITKIIYQNDNSMYEAIDTGFNISNGKYFYWLNSDDFLLDNNSVQRLMNILNKKNFEWIICRIAISNFNRERFLKIVNEKQIVFSFVFFIIMLILLSNLTANIGITSRHKWMIMPFLFLFLVPFLSKFKSNKL